MKHEIRFKGLSLDRDELAVQHGELALCGGVELHDGALRPSELQGSLQGNTAMGRGCTLIHVHSGSGESYPHYIGKYVYGHNISLYWFDKNMDSGDVSVIHDHRIHVFDDRYHEIHDIKSVGNVLIIICSDAIHYAIFKDEGDTEYYQYLGQIPEIDMQFGLTLKAGNAAQNRKYIRNINLKGEDGPSPLLEYDYDATVPFDLTEGDQIKATDYILAAVNQAIYEIYEDGYFTLPFFVRFALRMYDGSLIRHSAPILMMPTGDICKFTPFSSNNGVDFSFETSYSRFLLSYFIPDSEQVDALKQMSDIISSIDVYISAPIYPYNQAGKCKRLVPKDYYDNSVNAVAFWRSNPGQSNMPFEPHTATSVPYHTDSGMFVELPQFEDDKQQVEAVSNFFFYRSISIKNLTAGSVVNFEPKAGDLINITAKKQMTDDYDSHDILIPRAGYIYNARLNIFDIIKQKFRGFHPATCFNLTNDLDNGGYRIDCYVHINGDDGTTVVHYYSKNLYYSTGGIPRWFYYPDPAASKAVWVVRKITGPENYQDSSYYTIAVYELELKPHTMLNGAYWFDNWNTPTTTIPSYTTDSSDIHSADDLLNVDPICDLEGLSSFASLPDGCKPLENANINQHLPHTIYTSKTNNPFFFPNLVGETGINNVGTGTIKGLAAVTRALSTGQVGDHDLAVFATDGIWVLKVGGTGTYTQIHNISRDVCVNPDSICQLDQSVIFATDRALCRFVESDSISISDMLDGPIQDFKAMMRAFYDLFDTGGTYASNVDMKKLLDFSTDAISYFTEGKVIYDYESKRMLVLSDSISDIGTNVVFVFSITDQTWSTMVVPALKAIISGYPHPYYQLSDGNVYSLNVPYPQKENTPSSSTGIIITRTLAFSETMDVIQGFQQLCKCSTKPLMYFYGSNDQESWTLIGYSNRPYANYLPGHPYRYFRIAMYLTMAKTERYQELILDVTNKYAKL